MSQYLSLEDEVGSLKRQVTSLEADKQALVQTVQGLMSTNETKLAQALKRDNHALAESARQTQSSLDKKIESLQLRYSRAITAVKALKTQNANLTEVEKAMQLRAIELQQNVVSFQQDKAKLIETIQSMMRQQDKTAQPSSGSEVGLTKSNGEEKSSDTHLLDVARLLREDNAGLKKEVLNLRGVLNDDTHEIVELKTSIGHKDALIKRLQVQEQEKSSTAIAEAPASNTTKDSDAWDLVHELQAKNLEMLNQLEAENKQVADLEAQLKSLKGDKENLIATLQGFFRKSHQQQQEAPQHTQEAKKSTSHSNTGAVRQEQRTSAALKLSKASTKESSGVKGRVQAKVTVRPYHDQIGQHRDDPVAVMGETAAMDSFAAKVDRELLARRWASFPSHDADTQKSPLAKDLNDLSSLANKKPAEAKTQKIMQKLLIKKDKKVTMKKPAQHWPSPHPADLGSDDGSDVSLKRRVTHIIDQAHQELGR